MDYSFPILANESMDYYFPVQAIFSSFLYSGYPSLLGVMVICHVNNSTYTLILNKIILEAQQYFWTNFFYNVKDQGRKQTHHFCVPNPQKF